MSTEISETENRSELGATEVAQLLGETKPVVLIDVRSVGEFSGEHIPGSRCLPLHELARRVDELDRAATTVLVCQSGQRSLKARQLLRDQGFASVVSLRGGIGAWKAASQQIEYGSRAVWSLERQVRFAAGSLVLIGVVLGWKVHPGFYGLSAFVGAGLVFSGVTDFCGMGLLLARAPWNRG